MTNQRNEDKLRWRAATEAAARQFGASIAGEDRYVVKAWFNCTARYVRGWEEGDVLMEWYKISVDAPNCFAACDAAYIELNADNRPNRYFQRSLSVGDVVIVSSFGEDTVHGAWTVEPMGWKEVDLRALAD